MTQFTAPRIPTLAVPKVPVAAPAPKPEPKLEPPAAKPEEERPLPTVAELLRRDLANGLVAWANAKHCHWQASGPTFRDVHLLFGEVADGVYDGLDDLGEMLRQLDAPVDLVALSDYEKAATVTTIAAGQAVRQMVEKLLADMDEVIKGLKETVAAAESGDEPGVVDLIGRMVRERQKNRWFLKMVLEKDSLGG